MNTLFAITLLLLSGTVTTAADQALLSLEDVTQALGRGDAAGLAAVMDSEVDLSILGTEDLYGRTEATAALERFFARVTPTGFDRAHQGASKSEDAQYVIGILTTAKGRYKVYVYVAKRSGGVVLQTLRIEAE